MFLSPLTMHFLTPLSIFDGIVPDRPEWGSSKASKIPHIFSFCVLLELFSSSPTIQSIKNTTPLQRFYNQLANLKGISSLISRKIVWKSHYLFPKLRLNFCYFLNHNYSYLMQDSFLQANHQNGYMHIIAQNKQYW